MQDFICTKVVRNKSGKILYYILINRQQIERQVTPELLKQAIGNNKVICRNLKLTTDGRIIVGRGHKPEQVVLAEQEYHRYIILDNLNKSEVGGLFIGTGKIINKLLDGETKAEYEDGEDLDRMLGNLESTLKYPNINSENNTIPINFYYTNLGNIKVTKTINEIAKILKDYNYDIKHVTIKNVDKSKVAYEDEDQIGIYA